MVASEPPAVVAGADLSAMNWNDLLRASALVLVIEGVLPFVSPARARMVFTRMSGIGNRGLRLIGLGSMIVGVVLLQLTHLYLED